MNEYDSNAKCCPPLRTQDDVDAIKAGLADGTIDVIATDHAPHALEEKEVELPYAPFGMIGLETALPLVITNLVKTNVLSLADAIAKLTIAPAKVLGLKSGTLAIGSVADVTIIDPEAAVKVDASRMKSLARNTPFDGAKLTGKVVATIVGGHFRFDGIKVRRGPAQLRKSGMPRGHPGAAVRVLQVAALPAD